MEVYYESLCPDSQNFFRLQFDPVYEKLGKYLKVTLNPFGHGSVSLSSSVKIRHSLTTFTFQFEPTTEGGWTFECQHGPSECYGNLIQACALDRIATQDLKAEYATCIMTTKDSSLSWEAPNKEVNV